MRLSAKPIVALLVSALTACGGGDAPAEPPTGNWRAELILPGGSAPFGLELGRAGENFRATLINGQERVKVPVVRYDAAAHTLLLDFPAYNNRIEARFADDQLRGTLTLTKRDGLQQIPFTARHGAAQKTRGAREGSIVDVSGRWAVTFTEADGSTYPAVGEFAQRGSRLFGTFLTTKGDYRFLGGELRGDGFSLSTFDGAHAFLFKARAMPSGTLVGDFWSGLKSHESWTAHRDDDASLPDADSLTFLKEGYERFEFSFPDTTGTAVSLDDPRFHGKAVVITLAGSWCPNCHDEAAFMATLYDKYRDDGLEVIALMFEHSGEFDGAAEQVRRFRDKFDIDYTTLIAGSSDKTLAAEALPQLNHVLAFPTTIFIGRDGSVRRIHTGFSGPGTGEHYTRLTRDFTRYVEGLLAENTPAAGDDPGAAGPEPEPDDASGDTTST